MNKNSIRTGSLTLLLLITTVALAALAILSYQTAQTNLKQTNAYVSGTEAYYANDSAAQELLATLDATLKNGGSAASALPAEAEVSGDQVKVTFMDGKAVSPTSGSADVVSMSDTGISASGLSDADASSKPALAITIKISGSSYDVQSWNQTRIYQ